MALDSDVAILGTGVAPLVAANHLQARGHKVLVLNPDLDFFREDSELPLDPFWVPASKVRIRERIGMSTPERALEILRPDYPGAIEFSDLTEPALPPSKEFHDPEAPHVRARNRLWVRSGTGWIGRRRQRKVYSDENFESLFLESAELGKNPAELEGLPVAFRFPGFDPARSGSEEVAGLRAIQVPRLIDVDLDRYRIGLLEYVRERLEEGRVVRSAAQIEFIPDGIRFLSDGQYRTSRIAKSVLVFWTPRLTHWIRSRVSDRLGFRPRGVRTWEEWSLQTDRELNPDTIASFEDMIVWSRLQGAPDPSNKEPIRILKMLRVGPRYDVEGFQIEQLGQSWASDDSFESLETLCREYLGWKKITVRGMKPRATFEWGSEPAHVVPLKGKVHIITGCDGPLVDVVDSARRAAEQFE